MLLFYLGSDFKTMKQHYLTCLLFLTFSPLLFGQSVHRCGDHLHKQQRSAVDPDYLTKRSALDEWIASSAQAQTGRSTEVYRIPVVFHVIYNNAEQNVSDEVILDQLAILNADYNRLNADTSLTRPEFQPVAASAGIEFYLAEWDPQGNPTNGITRTETNQATFINLQFDLNRMKRASTGGVDAWDVTQYLNIWVCNLALPIINTPFILGFATPPDGAPNWPDGSAAEQPEYDGVVLHYEVVGSNPNATGALATVNRGRTAVHEVGHYLGLRHIWGDGQAGEGCNVDDGLSDTPNAAEAQQQTCDYTSNTCDEGPGDLPDMLENYMDYSDESCMNIFTQQQVNAMRFVIENFRESLLTSSKSISKDFEKVAIFPNPSSDFIRFRFPQDLNNVRCLVYNSMGQLVLSQTINTNETLSVESLKGGVYFATFEHPRFRASSSFAKTNNP